MTKFTRVGVGALAVAALAACQDLAITNPNEPDAERALANPEDVETLVISAWNPYWARTHTSGSSVLSMPNIADEGTATYANSASLELSSEPRVALNNNPLADAHGIPRFQWEDWYLALANANEGLRAIDAGLDIVVNGEDRTHRTRVFAKYMQGVALGYLGLLFDRGYIVTEDTDLDEGLELVPYQDVLEQAEQSLREMITLAEGGPDFTLPDIIFNGPVVDRDYLVQMAYSFIVRFEVLAARTPAERADADWAQVLQDAARGITEDHVIQLQSGVRVSSLLFYLQNDASFQMRADYKHIGWADVSGNFQAWLQTPVPDRTKFEITTPDRRITGATPTSDGKYYEYLEVERFRPERGTYHFSWYQWNRAGGQYQTGLWPLYRVSELRLYEAEAHLRLGDAAAAAAIVNETRVPNGELPPVTASGVAQSDDCVPRTETGACADLEWALYYERTIETAGTDALLSFLDKRGWGQLVEGTMLQLPIPARELENVGLPVYTFGGVGGESSAPGGRGG